MDRIGSFPSRAVIGCVVLLTFNGFQAASAQGTWVPQASGTAFRLDYVTAVDASTAWIVGLGGTILRTTNAGNTWSSQPSGTQNDLHGVAAASSATAWAVGNSGTILKTSDGGATWNVQSVSSATLHEVAFVYPATVWIAGTTDTILRSLDGGATWSRQATGSGLNLHGIAAVDLGTAYVVGDGGIYKTTNGGATWTLMVSGTYKSIDVVDAHVAWAVELRGTVARTTDGGASWTVVPGSSGFFFRIAAVDATTAWVVGDGGMILKTTDGGVSWVAESTPTTNMLLGIATVASDAKFAVGDFGTILHRGAPPVAQVAIDIKPGSEPNGINCANLRGVIAVAILSEAGFDAATVDAASVRFGRVGTEAAEIHSRGHLEDVDADGDLDMVLHFRFGDSGIQCGDEDAGLTGQAIRGAFAGRDSIRTVP